MLLVEPAVDLPAPVAERLALLPRQQAGRSVLRAPECVDGTGVEPDHLHGHSAGILADRMAGGVADRMADGVDRRTIAAGIGAAGMSAADSPGDRTTDRTAEGRLGSMG